MEAIATVMVNRTSPAALSTLGSIKDGAQKVQAPMPCARISTHAMASVCGCRLYRDRIGVYD